MSLPLCLLFQGLPGPVGDPGPKGSRVSGPWHVSRRWGPGWALPVPPVGSWDQGREPLPGSVRPSPSHLSSLWRAEGPRRAR